jgi:hypothetical protein
MIHSKSIATLIEPAMFSSFCETCLPRFELSQATEFTC